ncbi:hypothetical protein SRHO_G00011600 [Serrasalmus rhombeus]
MGWTQETRLENHDGQSLPTASLFCDLQWICGRSELILRLKARWNAELRCSAPSRKEDAARLRAVGCSTRNLDLLLLHLTTARSLQAQALC